MKILYPHGEATREEIEEILRFAIEGRKRVKDQILRIDSTMAEVKFGYLDTSGTWHAVATLEEDEYPAYYYRGRNEETRAGGAPTDTDPLGGGVDSTGGRAPNGLRAGRRSPSCSRGTGSTRRTSAASRSTRCSSRTCAVRSQITIVDPYMRQFHQARNLMELIEGIAARQGRRRRSRRQARHRREPGRPGEAPASSLSTSLQIKKSAAVARHRLRCRVVEPTAIHDRSITTDTGWKILLGRGLDIFQRMTDSPFDLATKHQKYREVKAFGVTYLRESSE